MRLLVFFAGRLVVGGVYVLLLLWPLRLSVSPPSYTSAGWGCLAVDCDARHWLLVHAQVPHRVPHHPVRPCVAVAPGGRDSAPFSSKKKKLTPAPIARAVCQVSGDDLLRGPRCRALLEQLCGDGYRRRGQVACHAQGAEGRSCPARKVNTRLLCRSGYSTLTSTRHRPTAALPVAFLLPNWRGLFFFNLGANRARPL